jgi:hypothetical protein
MEKRDMLIIHNQEYFDRVMSFARSHGPTHERWLTQALWRLHIWADFNRDRIDDDNLQELLNIGWPASGIPQAWLAMVENKVQVHLHRDFAPASFDWSAYRVGSDRPYFGGGLIYHGDQTGWDGGYSDPFSVELARDPSDNPWSIHT